ncbi:FAD-dependent monooxygenase [Amycolatopsis anabasis]|uniref:FAD-dependent monooxygenase n=1 Tax=Amycolatopsis anabasis TaxID=1840409 RepID=UPI00131E565C|nr:FAD-dependent monooxygenase [Amycolatopsis anabasis]
MKTVLISGASIAGPALAYWLRRNGFAPTVVERAPAPRLGGQAVDIRGAALDVVDRMGLLDQARRVRTRMRGMTMLDGEGNEVWRSAEMTASAGRLDSDDLELLREDLTRLLLERTREVDYVFGDSITDLEDGVDGVRVSFEHGEPRTFDLVVGADGQHSGVRELVFGPEREFARHLGTYLAIFSAENFLNLDNWQVWFRGDAGGGGIYPVRGNREIRVTLGFEADRFDYDHRDLEAQKALLAERLGGMRWEVPRLLKYLDQAPDFYFDSMAQIHLRQWWKGRVALVGDAGYCASALSGQGTSLALVGAYVLADELGRTDDHQAAFARYQDRLRPFVELNQALATENPGERANEESIERAKNAIALDG